MKKIFKLLVVLLIGLVIALILTPYLFKGQIVAFAKKEINKNSQAQIDFEDIDLSLIKSFPAVNVVLNELSIKPKDTLQAAIFSSEKISINTPIKSLINPDKGININSITLDKPIINFITFKDGRTNLDQIIQSNEGNDNDAYLFGSFNSFKVNQGSIGYEDQKTNLIVLADDINHESKGDFKNVVFDLITQTKIGALTVKYAGINYLTKVLFDSNIDINIDLDKKKYELLKNMIEINNLDLVSTGSISQLGDGYALSLDIKAPNNKVADILSLVPQFYKKDIKNIESKGNSFLEAKLNGIYDSTRGSYPNFNLKSRIENGYVKYPSSEIPVEAINLDLEINNSSKDLSDLSINLRKLDFNLLEDKFSANAKIENAANNGDIAGIVKGKIDLNKVHKALNLEDLEYARGELINDFSFQTTKEDLINNNIDKLGMKGNILANNIDFKFAQWPIKLDKAEAKLQATSISTSLVNLAVGQSDFNGTVVVNDPLKFLTQAEPLDMNLNLSSENLNLDELMILSNESQVSEVTATPDYYYQNKIKGEYKAKKIKYEDYKLEDLNINADVYNEDFSFTASSIKAENNLINFRGKGTNLKKYLFEKDTLTGAIHMDANQLDLNAFIKEGESEANTSLVEIPKEIALSLYPEIGKMSYDTYTLEGVKGKISTSEGIAYLSNGYAKLMNGNIRLEGKYDTKDLKNPLYDLKYDLSGLQFKSLFDKSSSFKKLAPIAEFIEGKFNSTLVISGPLHQDMTPNLLKSSAAGFLETLNSKVSGFGPIEKISEAIGLTKLKNLNLEDTKNWFDLKDGFVILKPHDHKVDDMIFNVSGKHSLEQQIDYKVKAIIPRDKLSKDKLGKNIEFGMDYLEKEANSRGVNLDLGDMIYLDIFLTGSIKSPKVKVIPVGSGGKTLKEVVSDEIKKQTNILKDTLQKELEKRTDQIKDRVQDSISNKANQVKDKVKSEVEKQAEQQAEKLKDKIRTKIDSTLSNTIVDSLKNKTRDKVGDVIKTSSQGEIDSLKAKLNDWNPFKKNKG